MSEDDGLNLSLKDRLLLRNHFKILEKLYPDEASSYRQRRTIVEQGFKLHYSDLALLVGPEELPKKESERVMDVLDMFSALQSSYGRLEDKGGIEMRQVQFPGFDGNNETHSLEYARFLILDQGRWPELVEGREGFDLNSHRNDREMFSRMLNAWNKLGRRWSLSLDEVKTIVEARHYPEDAQ